MRVQLRHFFLLTLVPLVGAFAIGSARRATAFNYLDNGGFESGNTAWAASPSADLDSVGDDVVYVREGAHSGRIVLHASSSTFSIRQSVRTGAPAGLYHFAVWIRTTSPTTDVYADANDSATLDAVKLHASGSQNVWIALAADVNVTSSSQVVIAIEGRGSPGDVLYVDGVQFEGAPPVAATETLAPATTTDSTATRTPTSTKTPQATVTPSDTDTPVPEPIGADLRNGGFESVGADNAPAAWQTYGGSLSTTASDVHGGSRAARFQSDTDSTKWLYQIVSIVGGDWYAFDAWIRDGDAAVKSASLRVSWYASDDGTGRATASADSLTSLTVPEGEYRHLETGGVAAPATAHSARLRVLLAPRSAASASILVDDASFGPGDPAPDDAALAATTDETTGHAVLGKSSAPAANGLQQEPQASTRRASVGGRLLINEVMYDPSGDDTAEWVELYNPGNEPISLGGWSLADATGADTLPEGRIGPREFAVIAASDSFRGAFPDYAGTLLVLGGRIGNGLGNAGDRLALRDASGGIVDAISWGTDTSVLRPPITTVPAGHSIERRVPGADSDSAADWVDNMRPSPGAAFEPAQPAGSAQSEHPNAGTLEPSREVSLSWLPWGIAGLSAIGLLAVLSWRAAPIVTQRLRRQV